MSANIPKHPDLPAQRGSVQISAIDWCGTLSLRFAHRRVPDCRRCGIYVGAICETLAGVRAVINVNCLDNRAAFIRQPVPVDHDLHTWRS